MHVRNAVTLVWGSLRLAPIMHELVYSTFHGSIFNYLNVAIQVMDVQMLENICLATLYIYRTLDITFHESS